MLSRKYVRNNRVYELPEAINNIKILGYLEHRGYNLYLYAECPECKQHWITARGSLQSGRAKRCKKCTYKGENNPNYKHGELCKQTSNRFTSVLYTKYHNMIKRCYNLNDSHYKSYGAKGIEVCNEWLQDFNSFKAWALANGYSKELHIHRKVNSKGYSPDNCIFITKEAHKDEHRNRPTYRRIK